MGSAGTVGRRAETALKRRRGLVRVPASPPGPGPGGLAAVCWPGPGGLVAAARDGALRVAVVGAVRGDQREPQRYGAADRADDSAALHGGLVERHLVTGEHHGAEGDDPAALA